MDGKRCVEICVDEVGADASARFRFFRVSDTADSPLTGHESGNIVFYFVKGGGAAMRGFVPLGNHMKRRFWNGIRRLREIWKYCL